MGQGRHHWKKLKSAANASSPLRAVKRFEDWLLGRNSQSLVVPQNGSRAAPLEETKSAANTSSPLRSRVPARIGPERAADGRIGDHEADGVGDFLRLDQTPE